MLLLSEHHDPGAVSDRLHEADVVTADLMSQVIEATCRRFPSIGQSGKTARIVPEWLDQSIEARHADLPLAILSAYLDAGRISAPSRRTSVPPAPRDANAVVYTPFCCDNFA
jgi:hypothetical protein